jgi:hypothetical protein
MQRSKFTNAATMRSQACERELRALGKAGCCTESKRRCAREAVAPDASSLTTRIERQTERAKNVIRWTLFYQMAGDEIRRIADCSVAVR